MTTAREPLARRYLLGQASEEECAAIEREYFAHEPAGDSVAAAEDELIEDYLSDRLAPADREAFERHYLASPAHRRRVDAVRRLTTAARNGASLARTRISVPAWWLAAAAILVVAAAVTLTRARRGTDTAVVPAASNIPATTPEVRAPRVFTLSISPAAVRSGGDTRSAAIPAGTEVVVLHLESEMTGGAVADGRVVIRSVSGTEVWRGGVAIGGVVPAGVLARVDVPAARLPADDYVIELFGTDANGVERELARYFVRVVAG